MKVVSLLAWLCVLPVVACSTPTQVVSTPVATIDIAGSIGQPPEHVGEQVFGRRAAPRYSFEMIDSDVHYGVIDLGYLTDLRCEYDHIGRQSGPSLVYRNHLLLGTTGYIGAFINPPRAVPPAAPPRNDVLSHLLGVWAVPHPDYADAGAPPAPLPLSGGAAHVAAALATPPRAGERYIVSCVSYSGGDATTSLQALPVVLPLMLFQPADNTSRAHAQQHGGVLYDLLQVGRPLPQDFVAQLLARGVRHRAFEDQDQSYQIIVFDMGGVRTRNIAQPRWKAYAGVRSGVVEWKAYEPGGVIGRGLCRASDGLMGPVRDGCNSVGYFEP